VGCHVTTNEVVFQVRPLDQGKTGSVLFPHRVSFLQWQRGRDQVIADMAITSVAISSIEPLAIQCIVNPSFSIFRKYVICLLAKRWISVLGLAQNVSSSNSAKR